MKYLRYILILIMKVVGKIIGVPMFYLLLPLRFYVTNRVFNYVLQNDIHLPRLIKKQYVLVGDKYIPQVKSYKEFILKDEGYIAYKKVSMVEYYFALCIWIWFDNDSNYDTHDGIPEEETPEKPFGNTWDLGDKRAEYPIVDGTKTFKWVLRNSFYNANYMFEEVAEGSKNAFYVKLSKLGWHFGFIPYTNSTRQGRMVWFTEDYDKLD